MIVCLVLGGSCSESANRGNPERDSLQVEHEPVERSEEVNSFTQKSPESDSLSSVERQKLDHALTLLLREGPDNPFFSYQIRHRSDSVETYSVLIRSSDPSALANSSLSLGDGSSKIVTGHLTIEEIRRAAELGSVVSIANPSDAELH